MLRHEARCDCAELAPTFEPTCGAPTTHPHPRIHPLHPPPLSHARARAYTHSPRVAGGGLARAQRCVGFPCQHAFRVQCLARALPPHERERLAERGQDALEEVQRDFTANLANLDRYE